MMMDQTSFTEMELSQIRHFLQVLQQDKEIANKMKLYREIEDIIKDYDHARALQWEKKCDDIVRKLSKMVKLKDNDDWMRYHVCDRFPEVDKRSIAFCCTPLKYCPYRESFLIAIGKNNKVYGAAKVEFAETFYKNKQDSTSKKGFR